ncbi:Protein CBR-CKK-1 [Caenorhabditis briggsae]|uniref:calcium/calmodulin-dependent protein kinase n=3 Tax=Caenorhabditis briggsae TaxID=6238 RepID=A8X848_CAEBR|nr:Protein CBR-CKK-1 [Caenorhabditis briggsae]CAP28809.2 Protein CBR-CKK-1 [Caenorhabditis briggsae]
MKNTFARYSLTIPSIPENVISHLRQWNEWMVGDTSDDSPGPSSQTNVMTTTGTVDRRSLLSAASMVRQQSDTTGVRRLVRARAVQEDDEAGPHSSNNLAATMSPNLSRPTRYVKSVSQQRSESYIQLNQYRLMEEIGQGSYGIVKLAYNEEDKNLYALKVLDKMKLLKNFACFRQPPPRRNKENAAPSVLKNPLQLVQKEIAILKKLSHPNVVKLVEVLDDPNDNYLYMVFEFVEKGSILEIPTDKPLDEDTAWSYFRDTLCGLEYLHYQKIVHRDIKPSNLLLSDIGQVKIADFGVSCEFEGIDAFLSGTAGTPAFMAPEALTEGANHFYSGRAQDIWSLGITLYAFVIGTVPFVDNYIIALHKKIKNDPIIFPEAPVLSEALQDLILGMLKKDPGHRLMLHEVKVHTWVTRGGTIPMSSEQENCHLVTVTEEEIENCVRVIPRLDTLILVKAMGHRKRFGNPFRNKLSAQSSIRDRRKSSSVKDPTYVPPPNSPPATSNNNSKVDRPEIKCIEMNLSGLTLKVDEAMQPKVESARQ